MIELVFSSRTLSILTFIPGNQAILTLKNDKPILKFLGVGNSEHVQQLNGVLAQATVAVGGTFVGSPFYAALGQQEITVHAMYVTSVPNEQFADRTVVELELVSMVLVLTVAQTTWGRYSRVEEKLSMMA